MNKLGITGVETDVVRITAGSRKNLKDIVKQYIKGDVTKEEATEQITNQRDQVKEILRGLGADSDKGNFFPGLVHDAVGSPGDVLRVNLVAYAMRDDGSIDRNVIDEV